MSKTMGFVRRSTALGFALALAVGCAGDDEPDADSLEIAAEQEEATIALRSGSIDTRSPATVPDTLRADDSDRVLVKFPGPPTAAQLEALHAAGTVYTYVPRNAFLMRLAANRRTAESLAALGATWSGPYHPAYKVAPGVNDAIRQRAGVDTIVMLQTFPDADLGRIRTDVEQLGYRVVGADMGERFGRVRLIAPGSELARERDALARHPDVYWIDVESRFVLLNDTTVWVGQSGVNGGQATPIFDRGLHGEGQVVGIIDSGVDPDMCFFRDATRGLPPTNSCNGGTAQDQQQRKVVAYDFLWDEDCEDGVESSDWDNDGHGTHVAGTVAGDNLASIVGHDSGDGMAPAAKLVIQDGGDTFDDCADLPGIGCPVVDLNPLFAQAYAQGARLHTNSWGDNENASVQNDYTAASQDVDEFMWAHKDFQIFFAAGNSGPGAESVGSPSTAKSAFSVGATQRGTSAERMASFSSCGPTDDGRVKPDITIPGQGIVSARTDADSGSNNCGTMSSSGTSMASPAAAGLGALVRQYYVDGFYPSGAKNAADAFAPTSALIRATMINSARPMSGVGSIPSNCQGWGRVTLDDGLAFAGESRKLVAVDETAGFPSGGAGQTFTYRVEVTAAGQPLKVTLAWTDFPSTPSASVHLVNDLDLQLAGPAGTFHGNVLSGGVSQAGGSADRRNTIEQVILANAPIGVYTVTVRAQNIPSGPQPFAVVATGAVALQAGTGTTVFADDFESDRGWRLNPAGNDSATGGRWERGNPSPTGSSGPKQLGTAKSGLHDLVTGRFKGDAAGDHDLDRGTTTAESPGITLPADGRLTLSLWFYFAHRPNASSADFLKIEVIGSTTATVLEERGATEDDDAAWEATTFDLSPWRGQRITLRVTAVDGGGASLVEAAVDDVLIVRD
jgi:Subtilase family